MMEGVFQIGKMNDWYKKQVYDGRTCPNEVLRHFLKNRKG